MAAEGTRAQAALDELEAFFRERERAALAALMAALTPEAAFVAACEYRAGRQFESKLRAAVAIGKKIAREINEEEESLKHG
jgi:hypothetical protein